MLDHIQAFQSIFSFRNNPEMISIFFPQKSFLIFLLGIAVPVHSIVSHSVCISMIEIIIINLEEWKEKQPILSFQNVNITKFGNCELDPSENLEHFVRFTDISYELNADGYCDTVHAKYYIPTVNTADKLVTFLQS